MWGLRPSSPTSSYQTAIRNDNRLMNHADHVSLIRDGIPGTGGTWADFGSGTGAFTLALAECIGPTGHIYSIDKNRGALRQQEQVMNGRFPRITVTRWHSHCQCAALPAAQRGHHSITPQLLAARRADHFGGIQRGSRQFVGATSSLLPNMGKVSQTKRLCRNTLLGRQTQPLPPRNLCGHQPKGIVIC